MIEYVFSNGDIMDEKTFLMWKLFIENLEVKCKEQAYF